MQGEHTLNQQGGKKHPHQTVKKIEFIIVQCHQKDRSAETDDREAHLKSGSVLQQEGKADKTSVQYMLRQDKTIDSNSH